MPAAGSEKRRCLKYFTLMNGRAKSVPTARAETHGDTGAKKKQADRFVLASRGP